MALDLLSVPLSEAGPPPSKRRRLGWDVPDPSLLAEVTRLQFQVAAQPLQEFPLLTSPQEGRPASSCKNHAGGVGEAVKNGKSEVKHNHYNEISKQGVQREEDPDDHFNYKDEESLSSRYKILRKMGEGTFGRVLECLDQESQEIVAIKIVRSAERYREAAMIEIDILKTLLENDRRGFRGCVQMKRWFDYRNHICIVFEKLGPSLYDFLRANDYRPFSLHLVRGFGRQLLESVAYMHSLNLIHTDLKPENILLASADYAEIVDRKSFSKQVTQMKRVPKSNRIKLIDFGNTVYYKECCFSTVSTRHYRAPEVILG